MDVACDLISDLLFEDDAKQRLKLPIYDAAVPHVNGASNGAAVANGSRAHRPDDTSGGTAAGSSLDERWHKQSISDARPDTHTRSLFSRLQHWGPLGSIVNVSFIRDIRVVLRAGALTVISMITISTIYLHLMWWPPENSYCSMIAMAIFLGWNYLCITNLLSAATTGPGYVPLEWKPVGYCRLIENVLFDI